MVKDNDEVMMIAMKSPGGRQYRFSVRKTHRNMNLLRSKEEMALYLEELKTQGLRPQEENSDNQPPQQSTDRPSSTATTSQNISGKGQAALSAVSGKSTSCQPVSEDSVTDDDYEIEDEVNVVSDGNGSKRNNQENSLDAPATKRGKLAANKIPPKASTKKLREIRVQHCVKGEKMIYEVERVLLEEVLKRPPLFDWKLTHKERPPDLMFRLRAEIANMLNEAFEIILPTEAIENTFSYYRAQYVQFSNASKALPSGSGSNRLPKEPKHYEVLKQLDYLYERREQFSSSTTDAGFQLNPPKGRGKGKGKGKENKNDDDVDNLVESANKLINTLHKQNANPPTPPNPPPPKEN